MKKTKSILRSGKRRRFTCKKGGNGGPINAFIFKSSNLSTQENRDPSYKEVGIAHITEASGIDAAKGAITKLSNMFGESGVESSVYDKTRNNALKRLQSMIPENHKINNIRFEVSTPNSRSIFLHVYGTIFEKTGVYTAEELNPHSG
jgi:hypothetical protein